MNKKTMKPSNIKALATKIGVGIVALGLVAATITLAISYNKANNTNAQFAKSLAKVNAENKALSKSLFSSQSSIVELNEQLNSYGMAVEDFKKESLKKDAVINDYKTLVKELNDSVSAVKEIFNGFESDDLTLNDTLSLTLDKHDFDSLKTVDYSFNDEDFKAVKKLIINGSFDSNSKDFDGVTMLTLKAGDIKYEEKFSTDMSALNFSDKDLKISFLGRELIISSWDNNSITLNNAKETTVTEGSVVGNATIVRIGDGVVLVKVGDELQIIDEGDSYSFDDLEIKVSSVFYSDSPSDRLALITTGKELSTVIKSGDEFNSNYEWVISKDSLGVVLSEDFDQYDSALLSTESLNLFDNFNMSFESSNPALSTLSIDYRSDSDIRFKGVFDDENKLVFNGTEFINSDDESLGTKVFFEDSDYSLEFNGSSFIVGDVEINKNITKVLMNSVDFSSKDCLVKSTDGFLIDNPEDSLSEQELTISVPIEAETLVVKVE